MFVAYLTYQVLWCDQVLETMQVQAAMPDDMGNRDMAFQIHVLDCGGHLAMERSASHCEETRAHSACLSLHLVSTLRSSRMSPLLRLMLVSERVSPARSTRRLNLPCTSALEAESCHRLGLAPVEDQNARQFWLAFGCMVERVIAFGELPNVSPLCSPCKAVSGGGHLQRDQVG